MKKMLHWAGWSACASAWLPASALPTLGGSRRLHLSQSGEDLREPHTKLLRYDCSADRWDACSETEKACSYAGGTCSLPLRRYLKPTSKRTPLPHAPCSCPPLPCLLNGRPVLRLLLPAVADQRRQRQGHVWRQRGALPLQHHRVEDRRHRQAGEGGRAAEGLQDCSKHGDRASALAEYSLPCRTAKLQGTQARHRSGTAAALNRQRGSGGSSSGSGSSGDFSLIILITQRS